MKTSIIIPSGITALAGWFSFFCLGLLMSSKDYRAAIEKASDPISWDNIGLTFKTALIYTPTNIAILTCLAAFVGGCASRLLYSVEDQAHRGDTALPQGLLPARSIFLAENPFSSMMRGFAVYLAFIAGVYVTTEAPFANPTPPQYARIGGLLSLVGYVVGYDPTLFRLIINLVPARKGSSKEESK